MNLWKYYAASSEDGNRTYGHSFCAPTDHDARLICAKNGWRYDGEIVEIAAVPEEEIAMFEKNILDPTIQ